jgi:ribosome modulation factor
MSQDPPEERLSPAAFGVPEVAAWGEPGDDRLEFLRDDPEVDAANVFVRQGARDHLAGKARADNPYKRPDPRSAFAPDVNGWREGWMASASFHGHFNRPAWRAYQQRLTRWVTIQGLIDLGHYAKRGEPDPANPFPRPPADLDRPRRA